MNSFFCRECVCRRRNICKELPRRISALFLETSTGSTKRKKSKEKFNKSFTLGKQPADNLPNFMFGFGPSVAGAVNETPTKKIKKSIE